MAIENMEDLFVTQIKDLYDAEKQLIKALPKMAKASSSERLREAFQEHLEQTRGHVERLERIFAQLGQRPSGETCEAMEGLVEEGEEIVDEIDQSPLRDAGLIAAGNRVEHYEMAGYGSARTFAEMLGHSQAATLLEQTLQEERRADEKLTKIGEEMVNREALRYGVNQV
ncbi:MAG: ferritin-like domain-containing protein [Acidobacteria bacterium]|nr:ferritin-like domain-containing protein [Acidobacteriota bacterium]